MYPTEVDRIWLSISAAEAAALAVALLFLAKNRKIYGYCVLLRTVHGARKR